MGVSISRVLRSNARRHRPVSLDGRTERDAQIVTAQCPLDGDAPGARGREELARAVLGGAPETCYLLGRDRLGVQDQHDSRDVIRSPSGDMWVRTEYKPGNIDMRSEAFCAYSLSLSDTKTRIKDIKIFPHSSKYRVYTRDRIVITKLQVAKPRP